MQDLTAPARFLIWVAAIVVALGVFGSLKSLTYEMSESAIKAQSSQMSWGKVSRQLWKTPAKK